MKPAAEQDILLKKYLRGVLLYRETYEEVYDHIITALEYNRYTGTMEEAVNRILREDFGGYDQLRKMESKAKLSALTDGIHKYLRFYSSYFKWPVLPFTLGFAMLVYFTLAQLKLQPLALGMIFAMIIFTPAILSLRRFYVVGYVFRDIKRSVRDDIFARIAVVPTRLFVFSGIGIIISMDKGRDVWQYVSPPVLTLLYVLSAVYLLALIKLYRDEFKMTITV